MKLKTLNDRQLLALYGDVMNELRERSIVRSLNGPAADYAEGLVAKAFRLKLNTASTAGHDGIDAKGKRFEVKCRRLSAHNTSRQLGAIRGLERRYFDWLVGVLFNADFTIARAALIPYRIVKKHASFVRKTNSWKFLLRDSVWSLPGVEDVTHYRLQPRCFGGARSSPL